MKCTRFVDDNSGGAIDKYNHWAKDKPLAKDVIVHTHAVRSKESDNGLLIIVVFWDEVMHPSW